MEEKKTIFDYLGQIFMMFGFMMGIMMIFCFLFGEDARESSAMFALGGEGLDLKVMGEYFLLAVCITAARFLFFTDAVIKNMRLWLRTACMAAVILGVVTLFILIFQWFPADNLGNWAAFAGCFLASFGISVAVSVLKEWAENSKMEQALQKWKGKGEQTGGRTK